MPSYDYRCGAGHVTEVQESIHAEPRTECPSEGCNAPAQRVLYSPAVRFRGMGFYSTENQKSHYSQLKKDRLK
jgi:putative FmdB family regulatory protein